MSKFREYAKAWIHVETEIEKQLRANEILRRLKKTYPKARIALHYKNNFQLLVAVVLSAQCTDKKVNEITIPLFKKYKTVRDFARADLKTFEQEIRQTGFYHNKARNIIAAANKIAKDFKGTLPKTLREMITIPGVGRKSANVILGNAYGVVEGIAVDTHVGRLAQRFGLVDTDNPEKIEQELMKLYKRKEWFALTYRIIDHGRAVCTAQRRTCGVCPLKDICPSSLI
ncbi:MAG: endonuclease III [Patescibacteria group bacterium]